MERSTQTSIGTRILILVIGIVGLAFATIALIGGLAFRNLAAGFLQIVETQNAEFAQILNRNSERSKNRLVEVFEENARAKGETLIARDSLNLRTPFLDNSYTHVRESLQNSFNFDASMLLASFVVIEGEQIKAWQYLDREHKEGLSLPIVYDSSREVWVTNFRGEPVLVFDPGMANLRGIVKPTIRRVQMMVGVGERRKTVAAYEAIVPICECQPTQIPERLQEGEPIAYLRYLISLELLDQAITMEENELAEMVEAQRKISQSTLQNTLYDASRRLGVLAITLLSTAGAVIFLAFVVSLKLSRRIAQPIEELSQATGRIAQGDYNYAVTIRSTDEIGRLGQSFETMRVQVKTFTEKLQVLVDERTARLNEALNTVTNQSQKIREIMAQINQGILTVDSQLNIENEYSQHLLRLYPEFGENLTGTSVIDLVFTGSTLNGDDINRVRESLTCCLDSDELSWDTNSGNFPRQVQYRSSEGVRTFELSWNPIVEDHQILRFLLTIRDTTKELELEAKIREAARSNDRLMAALGELVNVRADAIGAMLRDSHASLQEIEKSQNTREADHRRNYVRLHTMKGAARTLGLKALANATHEAEVFLQFFFRTTGFDGLGFQKALLALRDELDFLRDVASRVLRINIDGPEQETRTLFEMLSDEMREAEKLCREHHMELGGLVIDDRVIQWKPRFLVDAVQAFRHAITNSLDHGYFKPIRDGKLPADVKVFFGIRAFCEQDRVVLIFEDEGYGFDRLAIRALAERQGMELKNAADYMQVLLRTGVSTAQEVTQLSGRGVGLSAIQSFAEEWQGQMQLLDNEPRGSQLIITLPADRVLGALPSRSQKDPASA